MSNSVGRNDNFLAKTRQLSIFPTSLDIFDVRQHYLHILYIPVSNNIVSVARVIGLVLVWADTFWIEHKMLVTDTFCSSLSSAESLYQHLTAKIYYYKCFSKSVWLTECMRVQNTLLLYKQVGFFKNENSDADLSWLL